MNEKLVYIASPYAGDIKKNTAFAKEACLYAIRQGHTPIAPHLVFPLLLDDADPKQRQAGLFCGLHILEHCDELWVCGEQISSGMREEISLAEEIGIPVREVSSLEICPTLSAVQQPEPEILQEGDHHTFT